MYVCDEEQPTKTLASEIKLQLEKKKECQAAS